MTKGQVIAIIASLLIGIVVCAAILALFIGASNEMFVPLLVGGSIAAAVIVVFTQAMKKKK